MDRKFIVTLVVVLVLGGIAGVWGISRLLTSRPGEDAFWQADAQLKGPLGAAAGNNSIAAQKAQVLNDRLEHLGNAPARGDDTAPVPKRVSSYFQLQKDGACLLVRVVHLENYGEDMRRPVLQEVWESAKQSLGYLEQGAPFELRVAVRGDDNYVGTMNGQMGGQPHMVTGGVSLNDTMFECFAVPAGQATTEVSRAPGGGAIVQ